MNVQGQYPDRKADQARGVPDLTGELLNGGLVAQDIHPVAKALPFIVLGPFSQFGLELGTSSATGIHVLIQAYLPDLLLRIVICVIEEL